MLGENHSLLVFYPEHKDVITSLLEKDRGFSKMTIKYNGLDEEIRKLEIKGAPIEDDSMHALKIERADLKDLLFQKIMDTK